MKIKNDLLELVLISCFYLSAFAMIIVIIITSIDKSIFIWIRSIIVSLGVFAGAWLNTSKIYNTHKD